MIGNFGKSSLDASGLVNLVMRGYESSPLRGEVVNLLHQRVRE